MINFSPGVSVTTNLVGEKSRESLWVSPPNTTVSSLTIHQTRPEDAGNYTCAPPHATSDTVRLYVAQSNYSVSLGNSYFPRSDVSDPSLALQQTDIPAQSLSSSSSSSSCIQIPQLPLFLLSLRSLASLTPPPSVKIF